MGKLRIAIVGCGGIANQKHMPSIKTQADKAEMVAFCDIIPERAEKAAKEYGVEGAKVYTDYKEMLADTSIEIDVVHVCTPNVAHCPITVARQSSTAASREFVLVCRLDSKAEVHDEKNWEKANPSLRYLPDLMEEIRKEIYNWIPEQTS